VPLYSTKRKYIKQKRLHEVIKNVDDFCNSHNEDKLDVLFIMLKQSLEDKKDNRAIEIDNLWHGKSRTLTSEECLALRVDTLQSKENYKSQYHFLKEKGCNTFCSPYELDKVEKEFLPQNVRYCVESDFFGHGDIYHTPAKNQKATKTKLYDPTDLKERFTCP
jgi:hypothetical protein